jgi:choline dehydrogenase-like flavoprotein
MFPNFKKVETVHPDILSKVKNPSLRGTNGPMHCSQVLDPTPATEAVLKAAMQAGLQYNDDYNGESILGIGRTQTNQYKGRRYNTACKYSPYCGFHTVY